MMDAFQLECRTKHTTNAQNKAIEYDLSDFHRPLTTEKDETVQWKVGLSRNL